jgi:hypothetical protein
MLSKISQAQKYKYHIFPQRQILLTFFKDMKVEGVLFGKNGERTKEDKGG